jgi:CubicO group peptidase (beta-lactamase class C family)
MAVSEIQIKEGVETCVQTYLKQHNAAGVVVAVIKHSFNMDKPYEKIFCFGYSKRNDKITTKENTQFRIGSLSASFTAVLLAQAFHEGVIKEEDLVSVYFPKTFLIPKYYNTPIKIVDLAVHASGLPTYPTTPMKYYQAKAKDIEGYFRAYKLKRKPGLKQEVSALGYGCLAYLLSRQAQISYAHLLTQKVLKPLGLKDTCYHMTLHEKNRLATGYRGIGPVTENFIDTETSFFKPVQGLTSNIEDLKKWLSFFLKIRVTDLDGCLKYIYKDYGSSPDDALKKWSLGFRVEPLSFNQPLLTYREGSVYHGFSSCMAFIPDTKTGVVILSNTEYQVEDLANELLILLNS